LIDWSDEYMDLKQLSTFRAAASNLSFTRTAEALNYVQSSVTAQIHALEEDLGVPLFDRLGKRVALTAAGERLIPYADKILELAREASVVVAGSGHPSGVLTIIAPETLCTYRLPPVLREFRSRFPDVTLHLKPNDVGDLRRAMAEDGVDVAFVLEEVSSVAGLRAENILDEPLMLVSAPDHPLASAPVVHPSDIEGEPVVLTEPGCDYRRLFERSLAAAGVKPATILEFSSSEAIKQCVMVGMGLTVLPAIAVRTEIEQGKLAALAWSEPNFRVTIRLVLHKDKWLSPALRAFLDVTREVLGAAA
jgi:DNA-binding transcriptional LysR family regulator